MDSFFYILGAAVFWSLVGVILLFVVLLWYKHTITALSYTNMILTTIREKPESKVPTFINPSRRFWAFRAYMYVYVRPKAVFKFWGGVTTHKDYLWKFDARPSWVPIITYQWK